MPNSKESLFGDIIRDHRKGAGLTIKQLSIKLDSMVSPTYLTKIEIHDELPAPGVICYLCDILCLDRAQMLRIAGDAKIKKYIAHIMEYYRYAEYKNSHKNETNFITDQLNL